MPPRVAPSCRSSCAANGGILVLTEAELLGCSTSGGVSSFGTCYASGAAAAGVSAVAALLVALAVVSARV